MAVNFNGTTSVISHGSPSLIGTGKLTSVCAWVFADNAGENGQGRILQYGNITNVNRLHFKHGTTADTLSVRKESSANAGEWNFPCTNGAWHPVSFAYDFNSTANDPTARVDFLPVTVTEVGVPSGTLGNPSDGYVIGNVNSTAATWDGALAYVQVFNRILIGAEQDHANRNPGFITDGLVLHWWGWDNGNCYDRSVNKNHPSTITAVSYRDGPPVTPFPLAQIMPLRVTSLSVSGGGGSATKVYKYKKHRVAA